MVARCAFWGGGWGGVGARACAVAVAFCDALGSLEALAVPCCDVRRHCTGAVSALVAAGSRSLVVGLEVGALGRGTGERVRSALEPWSPGALEPWSPGALEPWSLGALEPWSLGALEPWSLGACGAAAPMDERTAKPQRITIKSIATSALWSRARGCF